MLGNATGDITRDVTAIDAFARLHLERVNDCFEDAFMSGEASEGRVTGQLVVLAGGQVESAQVLESTVVSDAVNRCIADVLRGWRLQPSIGLIQEASPSDTDVCGARHRCGGQLRPASPRPCTSSSETCVPSRLIAIRGGTGR